MKKKLILLSLCLAMASLNFACSNDEEEETSSALTASDLSGVLDKVDEGVENVGNGLGGATPLKLKGKKVSQLAVDDVCDDNAQVLNTVAVAGDPEYPALVHYCLIAQDTGSPDSVQGAYTLLKNISCALKRGGHIKFDGVERDVTMTLTTACFTQQQIDDIGGSLSATVTGSKPADLNSNYSHGIRIRVDAIGKTFQMATNITGGQVSFVSSEQDDTGEDGAFAGTYDTSSGEVFFESRMDRYDGGCGTSSCGWSRHIRLYANTQGGGASTEIEDYQGIYTDISKNGANGSGRVATAKGNLTDGLYVRYYSSPDVTRATLADASDNTWTTTMTSTCYGGSATCTANTGIDFMSAGSNGNFLLLPTDTTYSDGLTWAGSLDGLSFTTVNFSDTQ